MLHITVETIMGRCFKLRVSPLETIYFVKVKICQLEGIPISHQILIWKSIELNNDNTLTSYNIPNNCTFKLTLTMKGGPINSVLTDEPSLQDMVEYLTDPCELPSSSSSSSSSSSLIGEKKHGALLLYRYGNHSLNIASKEFIQREAYSVEKWRVKFEDLKSKNERQVENNKLRGKMAALRKQMQKVSLNKEKKLELSDSNVGDDEGLNTKAFDSRLMSPPEQLQSQEETVDSHHYKSSQDDVFLKEIEPNKISTHVGLNENVVNFVGDCKDTADESCCAIKGNSNSSETWCNRIDVTWTDDKSIGALMDLRYQSSSSLSVSSSSETNLEETSINDEEEVDDGDISISNTPNSMPPELSKEHEDENNCLRETFQILPFDISRTGVDPSCCLTMDDPMECIVNSDQASPSKSLSGIKEDVAIRKDLRLPKIAINPVEGLQSRFDEEAQDLRFHPSDIALMPTNSERTIFSRSNLQPMNHTFLDLLRRSRMRAEREKELISNGNESILTSDRPLQFPSSFDLLHKCSKVEERESDEMVKKFMKPGEDLKKNNSFLPRFPPLQTFSSKGSSSPETPSSFVRKVPNGPSNCAMNFNPRALESRSKHSAACSYSFLPPINTSNSTFKPTNHNCLPKLPSPRLSSRKESFSPFTKKRANCLSNVNNSCSRFDENCLPWQDRHVLWYPSEDEEEAPEVADDNTCMEDDYPTLEIPGSLLSSDLSGCKVRVKKFVEGRRGIHSPNLNLMKMLEVVTQRSMLAGRRTGYIISASSDRVPDVAKDFTSSYIALEKSMVAKEMDVSPMVIPVHRKKCVVCRKKTSLAASFLCRCGQNFCSSHRYPETHLCTIDYKMEGRKILEERNPVINAPKLPKI